MLAYDAKQQKLDEVQVDIGRARRSIQAEITKFKKTNGELAPLQSTLEQKASYLKGDHAALKVFRVVQETLQDIEGVYLTSFSMDPIESKDYFDQVATTSGRSSRGRSQRNAPKATSERQVFVRLSYAGKDAKVNRNLLEALLRHPYFAVPEGGKTPRPTSKLDEFSYVYSPKVELEGGDPFENNEEVKELRKEKGWVFSLDGEDRGETFKMNVQSLRIEVRLKSVLGLDSAEEQG